MVGDKCMSKLTFIDMFAGIGGFRSGMEQAGHKCVGWIEWDKFARQSYQTIYDTKGEYNAKDIQQVQGSDLPDSDVWCFGFPCQDVSNAGKQAGLLNGKRSGLFFEVVRLLQERARNKETLPKTLFIENVKNLLSIDGGWGFARMQIELDQAGYDIEWSVINSAEVVPQNRERVYIIGHLRGASSPKVFPIIRKSQENSSGTPLKIHQVGQLNKTESFGGNPQVGRVYRTDGLSPTLNTMQGGGREPKILVKPCLTPDRINKRQHDGVLLEVRRLAEHMRPNDNVDVKFMENGDIRAYRNDARKSGIQELQINNPENLANTITSSHSPKIYTKAYVIRKLTPLECWRLQGFTDEQFYKAKDAGISNSQLYKQAGNAVTVPVVEAIAERLG